MLEIVAKLPRSVTGRHVAGQLQRCGTSAGADYEEARGAESRADFTHKLGVALKELKESRYWLRVVAAARLLPEPMVQPALCECEQLCAIIGRSILTARERGRTAG